MNIITLKFALATLLVAGSFGAAPAPAQNPTTNDRGKASRGQSPPLETARDVAYPGEHFVDGHCFSAGDLSATDVTAAPFHASQSTATEMPPDHYVGGSVTSDSLLDLDAKAGLPLPGHVTLGGEWLHSPIDAGDGHPARHISGVLIPF